MADHQTGDLSDRFAFGSNWRDFILGVDDERITQAQAGLSTMLGTSALEGKTLLDIGCGSGLMALAAHRLGATVHAFDYDSDSVEATRAIRDHFASPEAYPVEQGSVLDEDFMDGLGLFDVVYSWGVLHHTGSLWQAVDAAAKRVAPGGSLAIALYNNQVLASRFWVRVKRSYVTGGPVRRRLLVTLFGLYFNTRTVMARVLLGPRPPRSRGMDRKHDLVDWVGGYPFEVSKPEEVFAFLRDRGFELRYLTTCGGGLGCNEYRFTRAAPGHA